MLFILAVEIIARKIRNDKNINGIKTGTKEHKIVQFADHTTCTIKDIKSAENLFHLIDKFTKYSGLKLNKEKNNVNLARTMENKIG